MYSGGWEFDYQFASGQLCYRRPADSKQMPSGYLHSDWFESHVLQIIKPHPLGADAYAGDAGFYFPRYTFPIHIGRADAEDEAFCFSPM